MICLGMKNNPMRLNHGDLMMWGSVTIKLRQSIFPLFQGDATRHARLRGAFRSARADSQPAHG